MPLPAARMLSAAPLAPDGPPGERGAVCCVALLGPRALRYEMLARQPLPADSVRVRIAACGVNFPDLLMTRGRYQLRPELPFIPGMEAAGTVSEVGAQVGGFAPGDRVVATARHGLFATEAVVAAADLRPVPAAFTLREAAAWYVAAHTARHALVDRAGLRAGESVLVLGAGGGIGLAAVEIATLLGARVIAAASGAAKLDAARTRGAAASVDYGAADLVEQVRAVAPDGVDVIFDPVGGALFESALRLPAWNGRVLVVGFASGRIGVARANLALIKGYSIIGVRAGESMRRDPALAARSAAELTRWAQAGHLRPMISSSHPLERAADALCALEDRSVVGRTVLVAAAAPG